MSNITEFLLARIAEDEAAARAASPGPWEYSTVESVGGGTLYDRTRVIGSLDYEQPDEHDGRIVRHLLKHEADANGAHIARHAPARVLAECEAKRRIVELYRAAEAHADADTFLPEGADWILGRRWGAWCAARALAQPYADHPDFDPAWRLE